VTFNSVDSTVRRVDRKHAEQKRGVSGELALAPRLSCATQTWTKEQQTAGVSGICCAAAWRCCFPPNSQLGANQHNGFPTRLQSADMVRPSNPAGLLLLPPLGKEVATGQLCQSTSGEALSVSPLAAQCPCIKRTPFHRCAMPRIVVHKNSGWHTPLHTACQSTRANNRTVEDRGNDRGNHYNGCTPLIAVSDLSLPAKLCPGAQRVQPTMPPHATHAMRLSNGP